MRMWPEIDIGGGHTWAGPLYTIKISLPASGAIVTVFVDKAVGSLQYRFDDVTTGRAAYEKLRDYMMGHPWREA